jgi:hypothetical protein
MPARRPGGKAASRKARQRNVPRTPRPTSTPPASPPADAVVEPVGDSALTVDAPVSAPAAAAAASAPSRRRTSAPPTASISAGSGLSAKERADYHYVERDLRNIGILSLVMVGLLIGAWLIFNALGLVG